MTSIRRSLISGTFYIAITNYSSAFFSIFIGAILARLLTPEEFGIVALVTVFVVFFNLLTDFGLGAAIIQNQTLSNEDNQSIFSFSIILGFFLSLIFYFSSPLIANFYNNSELVNICRLLSLSVLFNSWQIVPKSLLQKELKFKIIGISSLIVQLFSGIIGIFLAFKGYSYYALVIQSILIGGINFIIFYTIKPIKAIFKIKLTAINKIIRFSTFQFMFNFINYFSRNADNILIGKFLGSAQLGYYDKSYQLMLMPVQKLTHVITPVLMPVLSKYQDDKEVIYKTYLNVVKLLATIGFPLSVFLYFSAGELIHILYGPQWDKSVSVFQILALTVGFQIVLSSSGSIYQATNRTDLLLIYGVANSVLIVSCILFGVFIGKRLETIAYGLIIAFFLSFIIGLSLVIKGALKRSIVDFSKIFIYPIFLSAIITIMLLALKKIYPEQSVFSLIFKFLIAGLTVVILLLFRNENRVPLQNLWFKLKTKFLTT